MPEASAALCTGLLGAKALFHLRQYHSLRSAFDSAKADVKQLASDELEVPLAARVGGEVGPSARGAAGQPAAPSAAVQQQDRTPAVVTARQQAAPEVSPLVQRGEAAQQCPRGSRVWWTINQLAAPHALPSACCNQPGMHGTVAGWCPLGLIPSWPPQPTPMAYSFFLLSFQPGMHSPTAAAGLILNEETGHIIGIGKGTYNRLGEWWAGEASCCWS